MDVEDFYDSEYEFNLASSTFVIFEVDKPLGNLGALDVIDDGVCFFIFSVALIVFFGTAPLHT